MKKIVLNIFILILVISSISAKDKKKLYDAARFDKIGEVKKAIESGVDVNTEYRSDKITALMIASREGHLEIVKYLISKGAAVNKRDIRGKTALMYLAEVHFLDEEDESILKLVHRRYMNVLRYLISKGAKVNVKDNEGQTALMYCSLNGSLEFIKFLVLKGAIINEKDNSGNNSLIYASIGERLETIDYLLSNGLNINEKNNYGMTALMISLSRSCLKSAKKLIEMGANPNEKDINGKTAIDYAIENSSYNDPNDPYKKIIRTLKKYKNNK